MEIRMPTPEESRQKPVRYDIKDARTGRVVKSVKNRDLAYRIADRLDAEWGAVRYAVHPVWP